MYGEASKDSDHPKDNPEGKTEEMGLDASSINENKASFPKTENLTFSQDLLLDSKDYAKQNYLKPNTTISSVHLIAKEQKRGAEGLAMESGRQKLSYGVATETGHSVPQNELLENSGAPLAQQTDLQSQESLLAPRLLQEQEMPVSGRNHVVLRHKMSRNITLNNIDEVESPTSSPGEETPPSENIAFMITKTAVQALSSGEVHDIVNKKGDDVQTVNIDSKKEKASKHNMPENPESDDSVVCLDKKPVIIIFDEPMDIRAAYKRLSTIFEECDEELEKMLEAKIEEEVEEEEGSDSCDAQAYALTQTESSQRHSPDYVTNCRFEQQYRLQPSSHLPAQPKLLEEQEVDKLGGRKSSHICGPHPEAKLEAADTKKKFKFKFPKKQLAALTQAIRTGTKTGKKTLQVVVYEEEEEDGTLKQHKEAQRFEIPSSRPDSLSGKQEANAAAQISRTDEIRKNTYRTLDSLEQTIKQLESTISEMSPKSVSETTCRSGGAPAPVFFPTKEPIVPEENNADVESPSSTSRKVHFSMRNHNASCFLKPAIIIIIVVIIITIKQEVSSDWFCFLLGGFVWCIHKVSNG